MVRLSPLLPVCASHLSGYYSYLSLASPAHTYTFPLSPFSSPSEWIYHLSCAPSKPVKRTERRSISSGPDRGVNAVPAKCDSWKRQRESEMNVIDSDRWGGIQVSRGGCHNGRPHGNAPSGVGEWNIPGGDNDKMLFLIANRENLLVLQTGVKVKTEEKIMQW